MIVCGRLWSFVFVYGFSDYKIKIACKQSFFQNTKYFC